MKIILLLLITALTPYSVLAAELIEGEREGKVKFHGRGKIFETVTFFVRSIKKGDELSYKIEMIHADRPYSFEDLTVDNKEMRFMLDTGEEYDCVLSFDEKIKKDIQECKDREGYCGECIQLAGDVKQKTIIINMKPPPEEPQPPGQDNAGAEDQSSDLLGK